MGIVRGEGGGSTEGVTRTPTKTAASNKDWKHGGEKHL